MRPQILSERPITCAEARKVLEVISKRDTELSFRSGKTLDYLNQVSLLGPEQADSLLKELTDLAIPRLKDLHLVKIVDIMPGNEEDLKGVLSAYAITVKAEHIKQILETLDKYRE